MNRLFQQLIVLLIGGSVIAIYVVIRGSTSLPADFSEVDNFAFQAPSDGTAMQYPPGRLQLPDRIKPVNFDFSPPPIADAQSQEKNEEVPSAISHPNAETPLFEPANIPFANDELIPHVDTPQALIGSSVVHPPAATLNAPTSPIHDSKQLEDEVKKGRIERFPSISPDDPFGSLAPLVSMPELELNDDRFDSSRASEPRFNEWPESIYEPEQLDLSVPYPTRNPDLAVAGRMADQHIQHGSALATRNAYYSARNEFKAALRLICQTLDAQDRGRSHSRKLAQGLQALSEADDFTTDDQQSLDDGASLAAIINGHRTPVLNDETDIQVSPWVARQRYYTYAQKQLAAACANEPAASRALYSLGMWYSFVAMRSDGILIAGPKAIVFHQAALTVDPRNYLAANELAVMLARFGKLPDARRILQHAVSVASHAESWQNLAVVHTRLGEVDLAKRAHYEWQLSLQGAHRAPGVRVGSSVNWVDPQTFIRMSPRRENSQSTIRSTEPFSNNAAVPSWMKRN